jgi:hypothetical protein
MRKEQPCLQHIRKLGWINLYASSVLRAKIEHTSCCLVSSDLRGECSVTCLLSAPLMHGWHSPLSLSAVMKPGAVEWLWILCNILDWVSCLQIPKIYSAYIVLKEYCQLTCWIIGHPGSNGFQKWFWCLSMVSSDFYLPRSEKGFQNAHRISLVLTVLPCLDLSSFCDPWTDCQGQNCLKLWCSASHWTLLPNQYILNITGRSCSRYSS